MVTCRVWVLHNNKFFNGGSMAKQLLPVPGFQTHSLFITWHMLCFCALPQDATSKPFSSQSAILETKHRNAKKLEILVYLWRDHAIASQVLQAYKNFLKTKLGQFGNLKNENGHFKAADAQPIYRYP